ncbi:phage tail protein [Agromyces ramosus]|uniref:Phage tail-like protein n=1 Tax=Agromyces ramosus TaxID=33879 RepID=A0ABU0R989_9MICO|nr:phage tail protein [Agromyces ramosus]MDQ0894646.1 phage tail-like protein [Agromyces ramosus]
MLTDTEIAVSVHYLVHLDDEALGDFASCEGLGVEVVLETREEGGNNGFVWQFPTRLKYPNIKLSRPVAKETADKILNWVVAAASGTTRGTGHIKAMTAAGETVAVYDLHDVVPVRWTGPSFTPDQPKVLTETLEIAHHGFVKTGSEY